MKSLTGIKKYFSALTLLVVGTLSVNAQAVQENADQVVLMFAGTAQVNSAISKQIAMQGAIGLELNAMMGANAKMKEWERKYNSYLKEIRGYAETMKAGTTLFCDGVSTFMALQEIEKGVAANPQGIGASFAMTDLYVQTAVEFIKTYRSLQQCVAKGGRENMLNGKERNKMLWELTGRLEELNDTLHSLAISIAFYNLADVWNRAISGMIQKSHGTLAEESLDRWKRATRAAMIINWD